MHWIPASAGMTVFGYCSTGFRNMTVSSRETKASAAALAFVSRLLTVRY
jgi:hypothetical protein